MSKKPQSQEPEPQVEQPEPPPAKPIDPNHPELPRQPVEDRGYHDPMTTR